MTVKINTKDGQVELTDDVIATVVGGAATEIFGVVGMASKNALKDNFQALLGKENYSKGVVVKAAEDGSIAVDVYTVLSYGTKISEVSKTFKSVFVLVWKPTWNHCSNCECLHSKYQSCRRIIVSNITTSLFQEMVQAASTRLNKQAEYVNSLNVFPVPDGDTGTNMGMTNRKWC